MITDDQIAAAGWHPAAATDEAGSAQMTFFPAVQMPEGGTVELAFVCSAEGCGEFQEMGPRSIQAPAIWEEASTDTWVTQEHEHTCAACNTVHRIRTDNERGGMGATVAGVTVPDVQVYFRNLHWAEEDDLEQD